MLRRWKWYFIITSFFLFSSFTQALQADPPYRVARLSAIKGSVSYLASGLNEWVEATQNWPITIRDGLWVDRNAQAELQLGNATLCIANNTYLSLLNLD